MSNKKGSLSKRIWIAIILYMFISSIAGGTESMFLGLFLDNTVFRDGAMGASITLTDAVNLIASLAAVVSGVTTFVMGALSEKMKNRKLFISIGFIVWGIVMFVFSAVKKENVAGAFGITDIAETITATALIVVSFALVLAFLRATTCDATFNSWIVDVSTPETSTTIEIAFTIMGFISTGVITFLVTNAQAGKMEYSSIFILFGVIAIVLGALGFFLIDNPPKYEDKKNAEKETKYVADLFYGFRPSTVKENSNLYLMLSSGCLFNCAYQVFFPYLFIYIGSVVIPANEGVNLLSPMVIVTAIIAITAVVSGVLLFMKLYPINKALSFIPSVLCLILGLLILSWTKNIVGIIAGFGPALIGYIIIMIQFGATVRDNIPKDKVGFFQGIRMIFLFFIPSIIGPTLGNIAAKNSDVTYMANGAVKVLPTESMFLYAAIIATLIFIPMLAFLKKDKEKALKEAK
jgi:MFS family permease